METALETVPEEDVGETGLSSTVMEMVLETVMEEDADKVKKRQTAEKS